MVDTDYSTYTIVYACDDLTNNLAILTRASEISDTEYNKILAVAESKMNIFDFDSLNHRTY